MHGPFFHGQSTKKQFSVGNLKAFKLTLRVFANDKWPTTSSRKLTVRLKKGTIGSSTKIQEWSQGRLSANDCHTGKCFENFEKRRRAVASRIWKHCSYHHSDFYYLIPKLKN